MTSNSQMRSGYTVHDRRLHRLSVIVGGLLAAAAASAAQERAAADTGGLEEITVTAARQGEQSLQSVPMPISVISPSKLDASGMAGLNDLLLTLPAVNTQIQSPGVNTIEMRGIVATGVDITSVQDRSTTSTYLDDAPISIQTANPDLRGLRSRKNRSDPRPSGNFVRGRLDGRNHPADHAQARFQSILRQQRCLAFATDHGGFNYSVRGSANLPLIDNQLGVRVAAYRSEDSGYIDNLQLQRNDANDAENTQARVAARWTPSADLVLDFSATYATITSHGSYDTFPAIGTYAFQSLTPERFDDHFKLYNLTGDQNFGFSHLVFSVTYQDRQFEDDRSFQYFSQKVFTSGILTPSLGRQINSVKDVTEEVRLISEPDAKLRWTVGAFHQGYHRYYPQIIGGPGLRPGARDARLLPAGIQLTGDLRHAGAKPVVLWHDRRRGTADRAIR